MQPTLDDMLSALKGQRRAREAIFWFAYKWHSGPPSPLYRIMCDTNYDPSLYEFRLKPGYKFDPTTAKKPGVFLNPMTDPEIFYCDTVLTERWVKAFGALREYPLFPVLFDTVKENDVVVCGPGRQFACIEADWPCRVFSHHGDLGVPCAEDLTKRSFHKFERQSDGLIRGFRR